MTSRNSSSTSFQATPASSSTAGWFSSTPARACTSPLERSTNFAMLATPRSSSSSFPHLPRGVIARMSSNVEEHMNTKRWLLASVAVFVVIGALEFLIHGVLLSGLYQQTASVWGGENEMRQMRWLFGVGYLVFATFFG